MRPVARPPNESVGHESAILSLRSFGLERKQQPAAQLLVDRMMPVAHGGLRHLCDEGLRVTQAHSDSALIPHDGNFRRRSIFHDIQERDDALR
jgi:hypothetical protein